MRAARYALGVVLITSACVMAQAEPIPSTKMTLHPAKEPIPALRYPLLPEVREQKPGNAALLYYRALIFDWGTVGWEKARQNMRLWNDRRQPPPQELRILGRSQMKEVDLAARRTYCDWGITPRLREEGPGLLLPDLGSLRDLGNLLSIRTGLAIEAGKTNEVIHSLQTALQLGEHVSQGPSLIHYLVGLAIARTNLEQLEVLMEQPDTPSLYWSLTDLPRPWMTARRALEAERLLADYLFPDLREMFEKGHLKELPKEDLQHMARELLGLTNMLPAARQQPPVPPDWPWQATVSFYVASAFPTAKRELIEAGLTEEHLDALPMLQVVLLHEHRAYDRQFDEMRKLVSLPAHQALPAMRRLSEQMKRSKAEGPRHHFLAQMMLPSIEKVLIAQARFERRIAMLRCIEALRLHASENKGAFPKKLSEIRSVPVPEDPMTGKPFEYTVIGTRATLAAPPPEGMPISIETALRYELTFATPKNRH